MSYTIVFIDHYCTVLSHDGETRWAARHAGNAEFGRQKNGQTYTHVALCGERLNSYADRDLSAPRGDGSDVTCARCRRILGLPTWRQYIRARRANPSLEWETFRRGKAVAEGGRG